MPTLLEDDDAKALAEFIDGKATEADLSYDPQPLEPGPAAPPTTTPAPQPEAEDPTLAMLRQLVEDSKRPIERIELPDPPMRDKPNQGMVWLAALADMVINKGAGTPAILGTLGERQGIDYENYQRKVKHAQDEASLNRDQRTQRNSGLRDSIALMNYQQRQSRMDTAAQRLRDEEDPNSALSLRAVDRMSRLKPEVAERIQGLSYAELKSSVELRSLFQQIQAEDAQQKFYDREDYELSGELDKEDYREGKRINTERRGERERLRGELVKNNVNAAAVDVQMAELLNKIGDMIVAKGADYTIPTKDNILRRYFREGNAKIFGGTGMDEEDTRLVSQIKSSALPDWLRIAFNSPNTPQEQEAAYEKWFVDGSLGAMYRFVADQREKNRALLQAQQGVYQQAMPEETPVQRPAPRQRPQGYERPAPSGGGQPQGGGTVRIQNGDGTIVEGDASKAQQYLNTHPGSRLLQ